MPCRASSCHAPSPGCPALSCLVLRLSCAVLSCPVLSCRVLWMSCDCHVVSCPLVSCGRPVTVRSWRVLSPPVRSRPTGAVLCCRTVSRLVLSYLVLSCPVPSCRTDRHSTYFLGISVGVSVGMSVERLCIVCLSLTSSCLLVLGSGLETKA